MSVLTVEDGVVKHQVLCTRLSQYRHSAILRRLDQIRALSGRHVDDVELPARDFTPRYDPLNGFRFDKFGRVIRCRRAPYCCINSGV